MHSFRTLLILLLCLTIPVEGWASVPGGVPCPHRATVPHDSAAVGHLGHEHANPHATAHAATHAHSTQTLATGIGSDCDSAHCGKKCSCGCGMGTCSVSFAPLITRPAKLILFATMSVFPSSAESVAVSAPRASLLRPPIG